MTPATAGLVEIVQRFAFKALANVLQIFLMKKSS